jgi:hypothetical protein
LKLPPPPCAVLLVHTKSSFEAEWLGQKLNLFVNSLHFHRFLPPSSD